MRDLVEIDIEVNDHFPSFDADALDVRMFANFTLNSFGRTGIDCGMLQ